MSKYLVTFSSGNPSWETTKWAVTAESRSEAIHYANLMHDDVDGISEYSINMITISKAGSTDVDESEFFDLDNSEARIRIEVLDRIWKKKFDKMENV